MAKDAKSELPKILASVTHELKTPLHSILSLTEVLSSEIDGSLAEEQKRQVGMIKRNAETLRDMISDLLNYSSISYRAQSLNYEVLALESFLSSVIEPLVAVASQKRVSLKVQFENLASSFICDRVFLRQIINNLVSNAIKYSPENTEVSFYAVCMPDESLEIEIVDSGEGIPLIDQGKVFQDLYRVKAQKAGKEESVGLGLALVKASLESLGGQMELKSELGKGTLFHLKIPPGKEVATLGIVAVIDADKTVQKTIGQCLRSQGYQCRVFNSLSELFDKGDTGGLNLIMLESQLLEHSSKEDVLHLEEWLDSNKVGIILMSALDLEHQNRTDGLLGKSTYLKKPFNIEELISRVDKSLINRE